MGMGWWGGVGWGWGGVGWGGGVGVGWGVGWGGRASEFREVLDCFWVGSLDLVCFVDIKCVPLNPHKVKLFAEGSLGQPRMGYDIANYLEIVSCKGLFCAQHVTS